MEELVEIAAHVIAECRAFLEAAPAVERQSRLERWSASGFQAEPSHAARARLLDDVLEQRRADALAQMRRMGAHRFHLRGAVAEILERPDARDGIAVPGRPDGDVRGLQAGPVEREHMTRRRVLMHA